MSDRLLYALSTRDSLRLTDFYQILLKEWRVTAGDGDAGERDRRREGARLFESLAFCEIDWESGQIFAAPMGLAVLPGLGIARGVLVGARSPGLVRELKAAAAETGGRIEVKQDSRAWFAGAFPALVEVRGSSEEAVRQFAGSTGLPVSDKPAAWLLANASASLADISVRRGQAIHEEPRWRRAVFDEEKLQFGPWPPADPSSYLASYTDPVTKKRLHVLWTGGTGKVVPRDWGRYLRLKDARRKVLHYDRSRQVLAVPASAPLPAVISRAAALCSGHLPIRCEMNLPGTIGTPSSYDGWLFVPEVVAQKVAALVGQEPAWSNFQALERRNLCSIMTQ